MTSFTSSNLMIIDTDCGVDDAEAILLALAQPNWTVLAITCVEGNTKHDYVIKNVLRVLKVAGKEGQVDVFRGSEKSLLGAKMSIESRIHGEDGLGGEGHNFDPVNLDDLKTENASVALVRLANLHPGQITLVTLGPLTNVAIASCLCPNFAKNLKQLCVMGGNHLVHCDPESCHRVLKDFECPKTVVTWETCFSHQLPWEWFQRWLTCDTPKSRFLQKILKLSVETRKLAVPTDSSGSGYFSCDLLLMAVVVAPQLVKSRKFLHASVELNGSLTRGQMVVDWRSQPQLPNTPNVDLVLEVDKEGLEHLYEEMVK